jgi:hypothetical protein
MSDFTQSCVRMKAKRGHAMPLVAARHTSSTALRFEAVQYRSLDRSYLQ